MKGTLDAFEFAEAIEQGLFNAGLTQIEKLPVADGGDGTAKVLALALDASYIETVVVDPLNRPITSGYYLTKQKVAIIEMADASGLKILTPHEYNALNATSFGTGQLIREAILGGAKTILLGLGGSATVDAGMGALMALGVQFYNSSRLIEFGCGNTMGDVVYIDRSKVMPQLCNIDILILSDVKNPLLGKQGSAVVFAPQKGATPSEVDILQKNLSLFAGSLFQISGKDISMIEGGGAAGGIAASFHAIFHAQVVDGASYILHKIGFYQKARSCDVVITGEGTLDETSLRGKAIGAILSFGMEIDKPVAVVCGVNLLPDSNQFCEITALVSSKVSVDEAMNNASLLVVYLSELLGKKLIKKMKNKLKQAEQAVEIGELNEGMKLIDQLLCENKTDIDALMLKAKIYYKKQQWGNALNALSKVDELAPNYQAAAHYRQMINSILNYWNKDNYNP